MTSTPRGATERPSEQAMKCAVEIEVCVALGTATFGMARVIDKYYPASPDSKLEAYRKALEDADFAIEALHTQLKCWGKQSPLNVEFIRGEIRKALAAGG